MIKFMNHRMKKKYETQKKLVFLHTFMCVVDMKEKRTKTDESPLDSCKPKRELLINTHGSVCGRRQSLFAPCTSTSYSYSNKKLHTNALYLTLNSLRERDTHFLAASIYNFCLHNKYGLGSVSKQEVYLSCSRY